MLVTDTSHSFLLPEGGAIHTCVGFLRDRKHNLVSQVCPTELKMSASPPLPHTYELTQKLVWPCCFDSFNGISQRDAKNHQGGRPESGL